MKVDLNYSRSVPPAKRGTVRGFTRASRKRMLQTIATLDWEHYGPSVLVTLTYPDSHAERTPKERTRDRTRFLRDVENHLGRDVACLWRLEYKFRKSGKLTGRVVPHFHLIILGCKYLDKKVVRKLWRSILHVKGPLATDVRLKRKARNSALYAAKYTAKEDPLGALDNVSYLHSDGRAWGLTRSKWVRFLPRLKVQSLSEEQLGRAMEVAGLLLGRRYVGSFYLIRPNVGALAVYVAGGADKFLDTGAGG